MKGLWQRFRSLITHLSNSPFIYLINILTSSELNEKANVLIGPVTVFHYGQLASLSFLSSELY